jgi:RNA polymerase sigma factor (sigma-70 family)
MSRQRQARFAALVQQYEQRLLRKIEQQLGSRTAAEDVLHNAYVSVWADADFDPGRPDAIGFLKRAVGWEIGNHHRAARKRPLPLPGDDEPGTPAADSERCLLEALIAREGNELFWTAVSRLPPEQQSVIVLLLGGDGREEIARKLGVAITTVYMRCYHARHRIREILGKDPLPD